MTGINQKRPNIVFILIDDMGWKDLSCYGSRFYETPNIDRLAKEGMLFTDAYAACPVCSPTRASILSGKYPTNVGVTDWIGAHSSGKLLEVPYIDHLPIEEKSLAIAMKEGGYATWHVGKWHLGEKEYYPEKHGFDINIAGNHSGHPRHGYFSPYHLENLNDGPKGEYLTDRITDEAINLIKSRKEGKPYFLHMSHYAVHTPIQAKKKDIRYFRKKARKMKLHKQKTFEIGENFPNYEKKHLHVIRRLVQSDAEYAAMVYNLDWNIGRLLDTIEQSGEAKDTIVFFTSDNGGLATAEGSPTCNAPLAEGKGWMYEGGVREPLIVKWSDKIKAGTVCDIPVTSPDFYPTILEMANLPLIPHQHTDGESIMPLLFENGELNREAVYWHYPHYGNQGGTPGSSVRMGDYKLIEFFEDGRIELYNLREDISEDNNLADTEPELAKKLQDLLSYWRESVGAIIPELKDEYKNNIIN